MVRVLRRVIDLPDGTPVLDLSAGPLHDVGAWWIGRYDEDRRGGYTQPLFGGARTLHVGIDVGAPADTEVRTPVAGVIEHAGINPAEGDYGGVLVTRHLREREPVWLLWGHLRHEDARRWTPGDAFDAGDVLARLGRAEENGGWPPHLHLQAAVERPVTHDLPGVVAPSQRAAALRAFPDPVRWLEGWLSAS